MDGSNYLSLQLGQSHSRSREETLRCLKSQFNEAKRIRGQSEVNSKRTNTGLKDTFQSWFIDRLCKVTVAKGKSRTEKTAEVSSLLQSFPPEGMLVSPVWRIKGIVLYSCCCIWPMRLLFGRLLDHLRIADFDPHCDTPVEILHVILLGFVKYFWRDAIARLKEPEKKVLIARLSSFDVSGLGFPPLSGATLVTYARSLVGRDFRAVVQAAPFVLHGLKGIPSESLDAWAGLSRVVALVWQPEIHDLDVHIVRDDPLLFWLYMLKLRSQRALTDAIDYFLNATCRLTPRWFNKPKFHILLHLPEHVRRFGPPMLFATEGFESFNAVIRSFSIHSNHQAPSRDIAAGMAHHNRARHLLSGGKFHVPRIVSGRVDDTTIPGVDP